MHSDSVTFPLPREQVPDWLFSLRNAFLVLLFSLGLKTKTVVRDYAPAIDWLCAEVGRLGLMTSDGVDELMLVQLRDSIPARYSARRQRHWAYVQDRFITWLVEEGAIAAAPPRPVSAPTDFETLSTDYGTWLCIQRGLASSTIKLHRRRLRNFLAFRFGDGAPGEFNAITRADIASYLGVAAKTGLAGRISKAKFLRSLFRFLYATGRIDRNLALCVPRISRPQSPAPPRHLSQEEVRRVLAAAKGDSAIARRDYAMLLTMVRLGLRGEEIIAVQLEDIDWQAGEILVRGKGAQQATMPLPVDVGEAMVDWIQHGRQGNSRHLFVGARPPFLSFRSSVTVRERLRNAFEAAGVAPPGGEVRCHVFRHSLAMKLLQDGTPLADIGNLLRHRSAETTTIYARHDIQALRALARPWPVAEVGS